MADRPVGTGGRTSKTAPLRCNAAYSLHGRAQSIAVWSDEVHAIAARSSRCRLSTSPELAGDSSLRAKSDVAVRSKEL
jgi:hypothetical protein